MKHPVLQIACYGRSAEHGGVVADDWEETHACAAGREQTGKCGYAGGRSLDRDHQHARARAVDDEPDARLERHDHPRRTLDVSFRKNPNDTLAFEHTDGFEIARQDLQLRGPGEFLGARQSGVPMLRFADLERDEELLIAAQASVDDMLSLYPDLAQRHIERWLGEKTEYLRV